MNRCCICGRFMSWDDVDFGCARISDDKPLHEACALQSGMTEEPPQADDELNDVASVLGGYVAIGFIAFVVIAFLVWMLK